MNPAAGQDEGVSKLPDLNARLRARLPDLDIVLTVGEGDAERAAEDAASRGYSHVFAAGGYGTLNEVVNGVLRVPDALGGIVLGVIPIGTGNDFARALGLSADADAAIDRLAEGRLREVDVAFLNDRAFLNSSAGGLIAETSERVDARMKSVAGRLAYLIGGAQAALDHEPVVFQFRFAGFPTITLPVQVMIAANGPTIGGGYQLSPDARIDDGQLDLLVLGEMSLPALATLLARVARGESLDDQDGVLQARFADLEFRADRETTVNTDGAPMRLERGRYAVRPRAARFLC